MRRFATKYGYFDAERREYVITRPDTPRPWVNVICPGEYGLVVSQTGGGYSWLRHASMNRITRWHQDIIKDDSGKYIYARDDATGEFWSLTWQPVRRDPSAYQVAHGIGYSVFSSAVSGIESTVTLFVPKDDPVEVALVRLKNQGDESRRLCLFTYLEWGLGIAPDWHREFHKTFIETGIDADRGYLWAKKYLWELPNARGEHWNRNWEFVAFHGTSALLAGWEGDKERFLGMYGSLQDPSALRAGSLSRTVGRHGDAIGSLHVKVELGPGEETAVVFFLGVVPDDETAKMDELAAAYRSPEHALAKLEEVKAYWLALLDRYRAETPDEGFNLLTNTWLKYQAISARLQGRTAYYQTGGAYGFRDQLQDSHIFLPLNPERTKEQIRLHARHQFAAGNVLHWWHPITDEGLANGISDNRLWLPFVTVNYLKETADFAFLDEKIPYYDSGEGTLYEHCLAAIRYSLERMSPRGLPLIGEGDWNDGMNGVGRAGKGESVWLGHFLYGILREFGEVAVRRSDLATQSKLVAAAERLKEAINEHGWDGEWYLRATTDDGTVLGSARSEFGKIFLNAQTWAILHDVADGERARQVLDAVEQQLFREYGPILFYPAYHRPDERIGYLSRYAPGVRENGGLYMHAACWAVMAAAKAKRADLAWRMYQAISPVQRGLDPDLYKVEPYVTPGNVDGPDSPNFGRGGWTWYTGSAAWLFRVSTEWLLGIRPEYDGLRVDPCIPSDWEGFTVHRMFRGAAYRIRVLNPAGRSWGVKRTTVDGRELSEPLIPAFGDGKVHEVVVELG